MPINKGYLTAKTDKASDETYTPAYAIYPIIKYIKDYMKLIYQIVNMLKFFLLFQM